MSPRFSVGQVVRGATVGTYKIARAPLADGPYIVYELDPLTHKPLNGAPLARFGEFLRLTIDVVDARVAA